MFSHVIVGKHKITGVVNGKVDNHMVGQFEKGLTLEDALCLNSYEVLLDDTKMFTVWVTKKRIREYRTNAIMLVEYKEKCFLVVFVNTNALPTEATWSKIIQTL